MDERGLWNLFFATGLPQAYLAIAGLRREERQARELPARTAFGPGRKKTRTDSRAI